MPKIIKLELIAYEEVRGEGKTSGDPVRRVEMYCTPDGRFVAEYDPHLDKSHGTINFFDELRKLRTPSPTP